MRYSRDILNSGGGGGGDDDGDGGGGGGVGGGGDGRSPNSNRRTPDHPPYSEMVSVALRSLAEENGSTESSISGYIQSTFNELPWGHDRLLPYYIKKLVDDGELTSPSPDRYQLPLNPPPSISLPIRRRGRPRLHPPNPNPSLSPPPSALPPRPVRSQLHRRRGRPPKILAEEKPPRHLEQGAPPLQRRERGDVVGRRSALRLPRSRGYKRRQGSNGDGLNCQSGDLALVDDVGKGVSECGVLEDFERIEVDDDAQKGEGQPFVDPEKCGVGEGRFFGEEPPLLIVEHGEGYLLQGEELPFAASKKTEFSQDQSLDGQKLPLLTPGLGKVLPFLAPGVFEHDQGQWRQGEALPFVAPEEMEPDQNQSLLRERQPFFAPEPGKVPPFLVPEFFEHDQMQSPQGEAPSFMPFEQTELGQKQSSEATPLLSSEQPEHEVFEHDQGQSTQGEAPPFVDLEETEPSQNQLSLTERPPFLTPEPGKVPPFLAHELFEHDQGQPPQRGALPFVALEETEPSQDQSLLGERPPFLTSELGKVPPFLAHELFEHDQGQPPQGEALPFVSPEQTKIVHKQSSEGPPLLSPEQPDHDNGLLLATPEESEDDHEQRLLGVGITDPKEGELVLTPHPNEEEVENAAVSSKKRKSHGRRSRSMRLWFES